MAFIYGDRFLNSMDEAMLTAGIHAFSSVFLLVEPAATNTEKNNGALSSNSFLCSSNEKLSILSFEGDRKVLGFSFSTMQHILCQCPLEHEKQDACVNAHFSAPHLRSVYTSHGQALFPTTNQVEVLFPLTGLAI